MLRFIQRLCLCLMLAALPLAVYASEDCSHEFQTVEIPACCENMGATYEECIHCGLQINYATTPMLGHDFAQWATETEPACTKGGTEVRNCVRCGKSEYRETDPAGHDYEIQIVEPQCTIKGYTMTVCRRCGDSTKSDYTEPTGHNYAVEVIEPTCTEGGYTQNTCVNCGKISQKWWKAALGHDFGTKRDPSDTCRRCGYGGTTVQPNQTQPPRETESGSARPQSEPDPTDPAEAEERKSIVLWTGTGCDGWFRLAKGGAVYRTDSLDPDVGPIMNMGRVHFLWGRGNPERIWLRWARMEE